MGIKLDCESYLPGYYSIMDLNEDSGSSNWPLPYGHKSITNGPCYNGFRPNTTVDAYPWYDKDALKQKMLNHETIFKNQVHELHRLHRIQRDMMSFPLSNSDYGRKSIMGVQIDSSPLSCTKGHSTTQPSRFPFENCDCTILGSRPFKVRKKLFGIELPADDDIDTEDGKKLHSIGLVDLNEPIQIEEATGTSSFDFLGHRSMNGETNGMKQTLKSTGGSSISSLSPCLQQDKLPIPSHQVQRMLNPIHHPSGTYRTSYIRGDQLKEENVASDHSSNHGFLNFPKGSHRADSKPAIDINLNEEASKSSSNEAELTINRFCCKSVAVVGDLNQPFTPNEVMSDSSDCIVVTEKEIHIKKILGFPIFESKEEAPSLVSTSTSVGDNIVNRDRKRKMIDINIEYCEQDELIAAEEPSVENENQIKSTSIRHHIDLNSCVSDCEDLSAPSYESKISGAKVILEIDLEAPVVLESEDDDTPSEENTDGILRHAAETIVAISSFCSETEDSILELPEASLAESLLWFVDACANELEGPSGNELRFRDGSSNANHFCEEIDDFEAMTLDLQEVKEADYMPKPFVPEVQEVEETGPKRSTRARRGRQRRNFRRDVLPCLAALSRPEVNEDIQIFGGLMRATGHHWNLGSTRRNGRGRRAVVQSVVSVQSPALSAPLKQKLNKVECGLEDRSLTGWGKTTRRPRRQRCPAANLPTAVLTKS